jgi:hypothetical protein
MASASIRPHLPAHRTRPLTGAPDHPVDVQDGDFCTVTLSAHARPLRLAVGCSLIPLSGLIPQDSGGRAGQLRSDPVALGCSFDRCQRRG